VYGVVRSTENTSEPTSGGIAEIVDQTDSNIKTHYIGAAMFSEGVCKAVFDPEQTLHVNLLRGTVKMFRYFHDGQGLEIFPRGNAEVSVDVGSEPLRIHAAISLGISAQEETPDLEGLKIKLESEITETIQTAQALGIEPFSFAEAAAKSFLSLEDWIDYDWKDRFSRAEVDVEVRLQRSGT